MVASMCSKYQFLLGPEKWEGWFCWGTQRDLYPLAGLLCARAVFSASIHCTYYFASSFFFSLEGHRLEISEKMRNYVL